MGYFMETFSSFGSIRFDGADSFPLMAKVGEGGIVTVEVIGCQVRYWHVSCLPRPRSKARDWMPMLEDCVALNRWVVLEGALEMGVDVSIVLDTQAHKAIDTFEMVG